MEAPRPTPAGQRPTPSSAPPPAKETATRGDPPPPGPIDSDDGWRKLFELLGGPVGVRIFAALQQRELELAARRCREQAIQFRHQAHTLEDAAKLADEIARLRTYLRRLIDRQDLDPVLRDELRGLMS